MKAANQQTQNDGEQQQQQRRTAPAGSPPRLALTGPATQRLDDPTQQRSATLTQLDALQAELDAAPAWKRGTPWWTDRERELEALSKGYVAINVRQPDGTLWRRVFMDEALWNALEALAAWEGTSVDEQYNRALAFGLGVNLEEGGSLKAPPKRHLRRGVARVAKPVVNRSLETRIVLAPYLPASRPPILGMVRIHRWLRPTAAPGWAGKARNCSTMAERLHCTTKTVQRDIDFMRDSLELPIEWDESRRSFFYARPVDVVFGYDPAMKG